MSFIVPQQDLSSGDLADWLELRAIYVPNGEQRVGSLWDAKDFAGDDLRSEEEDTARENLLARACDEINRRAEQLGAAYPFSLTENGQYLVFNTDLTSSRISYLLCLRLSLAATELIDNGALGDITNDERKLFQVCSTLCASGFVQGAAISFGWPRAEGESFLAALNRFQDAMQEAVVRAEIPSAAPAAVKDDEIDVIAWALPNDKMPGMHYLLGQVASGLNWSIKELSEAKIDQFDRRWYTEHPVSKPMRAMFIPFTLPDDGNEYSFLREYLTDKVPLFGTIFYRNRLPYYVEKALELWNSDGRHEPVDYADNLDGLRGWGAEFLTNLQNIT